MPPAVVATTLGVGGRGGGGKDKGAGVHKTTYTLCNFAFANTLTPIRICKYTNTKIYLPTPASPPLMDVELSNWCAVVKRTDSMSLLFPELEMPEQPSWSRLSPLVRLHVTKEKKVRNHTSLASKLPKSLGLVVAYETYSGSSNSLNSMRP